MRPARSTQEALKVRVLALASVVCIALLIALVRIVLAWDALRVTERQLKGVIPGFELSAMGVQEGEAPRVAVSGNPWRTVRGRTDLIVAVAGCGGRERPSAKIGNVISLRYRTRNLTSGTLIDSTRKRPPAALALGNSAAPLPIERALHGMCAGEAVEVAHSVTQGAAVSTLLLVVRVRTAGWKSVDIAQQAFLQDKLAEKVHPAMSRRGRNCDHTCSDHGLVCAQKGFQVLNDCARMRKIAHCTECQVAPVGADGKDMPCRVSVHAPRPFPRGMCLVAPHVERSTCSARHQFTARACPCFEIRFAKDLATEQ